MQDPRKPLGSMDPIAAATAADIQERAAATFVAENVKATPNMQRAVR